MIRPWEVLILILVWIIPSVLVAKYAARKGHNFGVFLVFGLVISWIVSLLVALLVKDRAPSGDYLDQLKKIGELRASGVITDEEFEAEKARFMAKRER